MKVSLPKSSQRIGYHAIWHGQKSFNGVAILADGVETGRNAARAAAADPG